MTFFLFYQSVHLGHIVEKMSWQKNLMKNNIQLFNIYVKELLVFNIFPFLLLSSPLFFFPLFSSGQEVLFTDSS